MYIEHEKQTNRQTDRQTERQTQRDRTLLQLEDLADHKKILLNNRLGKFNLQ